MSVACGWTQQWVAVALEASRAKSDAPTRMNSTALQLQGESTRRTMYTV
eukprot:CAMPEP_0181366374 /NCGR_PEP_ID=MMETSP1106-20121128/10658_1 /TAXON_ID=81844 /ORGANISM="Mantoniella antarctica, Strain SL-175" /LENGTH=48 /DNA_ID= /DNA_START= /DNA_END= /DNA_ORIENTATION=